MRHLCRIEPFVQVVQERHWCLGDVGLRQNLPLGAPEGTEHEEEGKKMSKKHGNRGLGPSGARTVKRKFGRVATEDVRLDRNVRLLDVFG